MYDELHIHEPHDLASLSFERRDLTLDELLRDDAYASLDDLTIDLTVSFDVAG